MASPWQWVTKSCVSTMNTQRRGKSANHSALLSWAPHGTHKLLSSSKFTLNLQFHGFDFIPWLWRRSSCLKVLFLTIVRHLTVTDLLHDILGKWRSYRHVPIALFHSISGPRPTAGQRNATVLLHRGDAWSFEGNVCDWYLNSFIKPWAWQYLHEKQSRVDVTLRFHRLTALLPISSKMKFRTADFKQNTMYRTGRRIL